MNNKYGKLVSNAIIFSVGTLLSKLILALLLPYFTRVLSAADYGTVELLVMIMQLLVPVCSLDIQDAVFRFLVDGKEDRSSVLKNAFFVLAIGNVLVILTSFLVSSFDALRNWYMFYILISIFNMYRSVLSLFAKAIDKTVLFTIDSIVYNFSLAVFSILCLSGFKMGLIGYFYGLLLADIISILFLAFNLKLKRDFLWGARDIGLLKEMLLYSSPLVLNSITWGMTHVVDRFMLTSLCSLDANGIYSAASKIPALLSLVTNVFLQAWNQSMMQDYDKERDIRFYKNIFDMTHVCVTLAFFVIIIFNVTCMDMVLGSAFLESIQYVPVLLLGVVFLAYSGYFSSIYGARKQSKKIMFSTMGGGIINLILNYLLIPLYGIMGACVATALCYMVVGLLRLIDSEKHFPIHIDMHSFFLSMAVMIFCTISCTYFRAVYIILIALMGMGLVFFLYRDVINQFAVFLLKRLNLNNMKG